MGANQSSKSAAAANQQVEGPTGSRQRDSFTRQQLNRLLGKRAGRPLGEEQQRHRQHEQVADCHQRATKSIASRRDEPPVAQNNKSISGNFDDDHDHGDEQPNSQLRSSSNSRGTAGAYFVSPAEGVPQPQLRPLNNSLRSQASVAYQQPHQALVRTNCNEPKLVLVKQARALQPQTVPHQHQQAAAARQQQPLDSSTHHAPGPGGGGGPGLMKKQIQQQQQQQLKSSCSPSSGSMSGSSSASSATNSSSQRSSAASSSSESFKLLMAKQEQQQQQQQTKPEGRAKLNTRENGTNYAIEQHKPPAHGNHRRAGQIAVAMTPPVGRAPGHRRAHSQGGQQALSWSRRQHQQLMLASQQQQQQAELDSLEHQQSVAYQQQQQQLLFDPQLAVHAPQQAPTAFLAHFGAMSPGQEELADQEEFYARNLHLLTPNQQQAFLQRQQHERDLLLVHQQQQQQQFNPNASLGFASAPLARRHKWPQQQQQQQQQQVAYLAPSYNQTNLDFHQPAQAPQQQYQLEPASYLQHQYNLAQHSAATAQLLAQHQLEFQASLEQTRSKSLSKSALCANKRSRNPLANIFPFVAPASQPASQQAAEPNRRARQVFGSNTIHRLSSSKSHQNLMSAQQQQNKQQVNPKQQNSNSSSLKRVKSSPLTAQQSSYEAMRTIDMYLIRQIARSCMDFEMEQKIDLEIRLRELASQSMLEARDEIDVLEVEKSLLTSDQRMNCYALQLEQQRRRMSTPSLGGTNSDSGRGSKTSGGRNSSTLVTANGNSGASCTGAAGHRSDLVGGNPAGSDSPSFSSLSLSKSSQSSPSKLSPVSGQSANSPPSPEDKDEPRGQDHPDDGSTAHKSRRRSQNQVVRQPTGSTSGNTLSRTLNRRKSQKQRQRERLAQCITAASNINCHMVQSNKATVSLSDLRVPLMWRDVDHFKGRGDYRRYAVFCLLKIGSQIYDTRLISDVDRQMTDLNFEDLVVFNQVEHDFELELEVYSCVYLEQFSLSSTPRKLKEKLSNSVSRAMGRRLATQTASVNYTKELEAYDKSYRFAMIASAKLSLIDASDAIKTYDLHLVSPEAHGRGHSASGAPLSPYVGGGAHARYTSSSTSAAGHQAPAPVVTPGNQKDVQKNTLPLFGHFCCQLQVRPDVFDKNVKSGYLKVATINLPDMSLSTNSSNKSQVDSDAADLTSGNTNSMLRSALAASSKLATISMSNNSAVHWAMLRNFTLNLWQVDEQKLQVALRRGHAPQVDISRKQPVRVGIDRYARLLRVSNSSLTIETNKGCFVLAVYNPATGDQVNAGDELGQWLRNIEQMIYDSHIWGSVLNHFPPQGGGPQSPTTANNNNNNHYFSQYNESIVAPERT